MCVLVGLSVGLVCVHARPLLVSPVHAAKLFSGYARMLDCQLPQVIQWHENPTVRLPGFKDDQYQNFVRYAKNFMVDKGKLYRCDIKSEYKLVIYPEKRMYIMKAVHDQLGHRGIYAMKTLIKERFWWPEMERDISWFVSTCEICQQRQKTVIKAPPTVDEPPGSVCS